MKEKFWTMSTVHDRNKAGESDCYANLKLLLLFWEQFLQGVNPLVTDTAVLILQKKRQGRKLWNTNRSWSFLLLSHRVTSHLRGLSEATLTYSDIYILQHGAVERCLLSRSTLILHCLCKNCFYLWCITAVKPLCPNVTSETIMMTVKWV